MVAVLGLHVHVGMGAFAAVVILTLVKAADEKSALRVMPWGVILMVCGVTVLTSMLEKTGGIDVFTSIVARLATHRTVTGLMALVTGLVSVYSSTSGVVLPAFLPSVPGLVAKLGGGNPLAIASSILIGGHLVDVSPAVDDRSAVHCCRAGVGRPPFVIQSGPGVGTVDVGRRCARMQLGLRRVVK